MVKRFVDMEIEIFIKVTQRIHINQQKNIGQVAMGSLQILEKCNIISLENIFVNVIAVCLKMDPIQ